MAPGSNNHNNNNNSNNNNHNRQTGTKPKTKSSKKVPGTVPREVVAPTRRDLQQLNVLVDWATASGAAAAAVNNHHHQQQQQQQNLHQPGPSGSVVGGGSGSGSQNFLLKPRNNRTPGEGTCYEIDNLSLQDNSRYIPAVRPIVRRNLLSESGSGADAGELHNTAVGVVIPTTPNSALQSFRLNDTSGSGPSSSGAGTSNINNNLLNNSSRNVLNPFHQPQQAQQQSSQLRASPLSSRVPDGASQNQLNLNKNSNQQQQQIHHHHQQGASGAVGGAKANNFEDKLSQIQEYIKLTTNLISSVQIDNSTGNNTPIAAGTRDKKRNNIDEDREPENSAFASGSGRGLVGGGGSGGCSMGDESCYFVPINSTSLESVRASDSELNGPRPQSVQSIQSTTTHSAAATPVQTTPSSYDDLRYRMENQNKNMQALRDQQAHLLRLQQAARQQLADMEAMRQQTSQPVQLDNFESVEQVQEGIGGIMERMRVLATFIQNQQELGNMLGGDNDDVVSEQVALQAKFQELRDKKAQMHSLVSELQNLNVEASRQFDGTTASGVERNVPIELTNAPASAAELRKATKTFNHQQTDHPGVVNGGSRGGSVTPKVENVVDSEDGLDEEEAVAAGTADMLNEKINEINAMKSQLRRLKEMMDTVKLMELKTGGGSIDEEEEDAPEENDEAPEEDSVENSRSPSVASQISEHHGGGGGGEGASAVDESRREQLNQRVEALHAMTRDLREQAKSIAAERDALKNARSELQKRRNNVAELQNQADSQSQGTEKLTNHVASFATSSKEMALKAELEQKKRELEQIAKMTQSMKKNTELSRRNTEVAAPKVSSVSSAESLRSQSQPPVIPPPPAASAVNNTSTNLSKHSADSGVTDIFANAHMESGSYQSSSTRSLNMVPPMPDICNRADRYHVRKSEDVGTSTGRNERTSPWPSHLFAGAGPSSSNTGPQSPHFHPSFGVGSDIHSYPTYSGYPAYANLLPPHTPNSAPAPPPDPLMFQHFMQTQQMLMNSITQCNQLLWIQQREINNLNNAVLLLQERILNNTHNSLLADSHTVPPPNAHIRAESTPPNNSLSSNPNANSIPNPSLYSRARSEQPSMQIHQGPSSPSYHQQQQLPQPLYSQPTPTNSAQQFFTPSTVNAQIQRNNSNITRGTSNFHHHRRHVNINTANNAIYEQQQQQQQLNYDQHSFTNGDSQQTFNNGSVGGGNLGPSNMINNLANGPPTAAATAAAPSCLNNLNNSNLNSGNAQQTQALNNQVLPGVRANNYWDNFRSYSRQNLLSSNSCKSNEDGCGAAAAAGSASATASSSTSFATTSHGGGPSTGPATNPSVGGAGTINNNNNINNQIQQHNRNNASSSSSSNKYPMNFNRNVNVDLGPNVQQPMHYQAMPPDSAVPMAGQFVVQPQQQQHHGLNQSSSFDLGELQFCTNPINLGVASKSGHPKGSGHKKYPLSLSRGRCGRDANLVAGGEGSSNFYGVGAHAEMVSDLNLASASNYQQDSKSTSKLFEALKENVYQEVKNLITANESRPHFLIQLFRELQLISSDPLRQRTLQSIQELYNRYIESTLAQDQQQQQQQGVEGGHVNNVGSNNLLSSGSTSEPVAGPSSQAENVEVVDMEVSQNYTNVRQQQAQQQGFGFVPPNAESTPIAGGSSSKDHGLPPSSEIINIIMGDIVGVINSVDYINDSVLYKIAGVICNHATGASNSLFHYQQQQQQLPQQDQDRLLPSMAAFLAQNESSPADVISQEDFLRHLESWNRTDKDEFISNLENLLNNILLRSSAAEGDPTVSTVPPTVSSSNEEAQMRQQLQQPCVSADVSTDNNETFPENPFSPPQLARRTVYGTSESDKLSNAGGVSSSNGYASTTYDLAEADQICGEAAGAVGGQVAGPSNAGAAGQQEGGNFEDRWRFMQKKLDDDLADIIERNRNAERVAQEQQQQQQQQQHQERQGRERRSNEAGWQDEDGGDGSLDPEEQLPIFY